MYSTQVETRPVEIDLRGHMDLVVKHAHVTGKSLADAAKEYIESAAAVSKSVKALDE